MTVRLQRMIATGLVAAAMGLAGAGAQAQQGVTDSQILLGEIAPMTGAAAVGSLGLTAGNLLAVLEANEQGGVNGRQLRLISEDDGYVVARTVQSARRLLTSERVFALPSISGSASSEAILPMLRDLGIPAINVLSFPPSLFDPVVPNIFVAGATHPETTFEAIRQMAAQYPDRTSWAVILPDDTLGSLMGQGVDRAQAELGANIVYRAAYRRGQQDFSAEILGAQRAGADIVLAGGIVIENIAMVRELERLQMDIPVVLSWIGRNSPNDLRPMGAAVSNVHMVDYVVADETDAARELHALAQRLLPADRVAHVNRYTLVGYAGTRLLIEAMRQCPELTWDCTNAQLAATRDFDTGIMSPISFDQGDHFSRQTLSLMRANPETFAFEPIE